MESVRRGAAGGSIFLWNARFREHQIRDDDDFASHVDYIHYNPVKHGWVLQAPDGSYSSLHSYMRKGVGRSIGASAGRSMGELGEYRREWSCSRCALTNGLRNSRGRHNIIASIAGPTFC